MIYIFFAAAPLLAGLLYASRQESIIGELLTKPLLSVLFIVTAVIQPHADTSYYPLVWTAGLICLGLSACVFLWLRPHLGDMRIPVTAYIVIITAMVICAAAFMNNPGLDPKARALVFGGALLFYVSDIFVARQRFVTKAFVNRSAGLPLYYAGQFMIAFSTGLG